MRGKGQRANLSPRGSKKELTEIAKRIKLLIFDVDGVLTDGSIMLDNTGNEYKSFHVRDGYGIKMLLHAGVRVAIVTGRKSEVVERRARELGVTEVYQNCHNKILIYKKLIKKYSLSNKEIAYMGDDIVDAPIMARAGFPITVADADKEIKKYALMTTKNRGGKGAAREVTDFIIKAKGLWKRIFDEYFKI
jgi:3-deoxy-D-manno-octulosonate 8-phosphate phosphatase (KDO 8-P phosphatase)